MSVAIKATRNYIRHPSDIPLQFQLQEDTKGETEYLNNISYGGLSFNSKTPLRENSTLKINISVVKPKFEALGKVTWCQKENNSYIIGVMFLDQNDNFKARMVEQICHIEHYKREVFENEKRIISGEEAAVEWIKKYAGLFPPIE